MLQNWKTKMHLNLLQSTLTIALYFNSSNYSLPLPLHYSTVPPRTNATTCMKRIIPQGYAACRGTVQPKRTQSATLLQHSAPKPLGRTPLAWTPHVTPWTPAIRHQNWNVVQIWIVLFMSNLLSILLDVRRMIGIVILRKIKCLVGLLRSTGTNSGIIITSGQTLESDQ